MRDVFAPNIKLTLNDTDALDNSIMQYIESVSYEDDSELADKMTLKMSARNTSTEGIDDILEESKIFKPGNSLTLTAGYGTDHTIIGKCDIVKPRPSFPRGTNPFIEIICYDPLHKLANFEPKKGVSYKGSTDSQIASTIASRHGIDVSKIKPSFGAYNRVQKKGVNDLKFLRSIADDKGFDLYLKYNSDLKNHSLYFETPVDRTKEVFTFVYGTDPVGEEIKLLEFYPEINTLDQPTSVEIVTIDKKFGTKKRSLLSVDDLAQQEDLKAKGTDKYKQSPKYQSGAAVRAKIFGETFEIIADKPFTDEKEAKDYALQYLRKRLEGFITGNGSIIGTELLQSMQTHIIKGIGTQLTGKYKFTRVYHRFSANVGYESSFDCRRTVEK